MSDRRDDDPEIERTQIRGGASQEPNDERTRLRGDIPKSSAGHAAEPDAAGNDDATVLKPKKPLPASEPNDDATVLRTKDDKQPVPLQSARAEPNDDETVLRTANSDHQQGRPTENGQDSADDADNATIVRNPGSTGSGKGNPAKPPEGPPAGAAATILRRSGGGSGSGSGSDSATILRSGRPGPDQATVLRPSRDDDSTVIRSAADDADDDDDRTIINSDFDDDSTILGAGAMDEDTTYVASTGKQTKSQGNSEAGRLLKNRFVLEEKIGSGGMGDVYKALDLRQQEAQERDPYIAIKLLNENFSRHKDAFLSLQRETSRTRGIPHPNIMGVYDFDREGDTVFMSMELLDGKPLDDYLKEHPEGVSPEDAWNIIDGISKGLMRAHDAGIVHSDFKPGNIFYTKTKVAKVFDFGIARAVSNPGDLEADGEKTVFDAGSLGALTPTYASYEMLKGLEPSKSDDVYAVALVAYELFMGKHPYDRVPADKAFDRGLKPKPVPFLKRRHWKALRKALELKGENRTQTIDEFYEGMFSIDPPYFRYATVAVLLTASVGFGAYQTLNVKEKPSELVQYEDAIASAKTTVNDSLGSPKWDSDVWHDTLQRAIARWKRSDSDIQENEEWVAEWEIKPDEELNAKVSQILQAYLNEIVKKQDDVRDYVNEKHDSFGVEQAIDLLEQAASHMERVNAAYRGADPAEVDQVATRLEVALQVRKDRWEAILEEEKRLAALEEARIEAEKAEEMRLAYEKTRLDTYTGYLEEMESILKCKGNIEESDLSRLGVLLADMRDQWNDAYSYHYPTIINYLSTCIQQRVGFVNPDRARQIQKRILGFLPGEKTIANLVIEDKDPCDDRKLEGKGIRNRSWCSDRLSEGGTGPELVVIPAISISGSDYKYAISRSEIKVADYNQFCQNTGCQQLDGTSIPATNISLAQAKAYMDWLSRQSGHEYRLPTVREWEHAATTTSGGEVDENINCTVDSRGVRLGEKLLNALSGRPNPWGLYNYVGNAREWATNEEGELLAMGGAHTDPRNECTLQKRVAHQGQADPVTGFRVIRKIEKKS